MDTKKMCNNTNTTIEISTSLTDPKEMDRSPISNLPTEMLQHIMEMLPLLDVLSCREVNHKWKSAATLSARKKCAPIPFSGEIKMDQRSKMVSEFNDCVREAAGEFPVSTFHITCNSVDRWMDWNGFRCVPDFFELVSPFISELSLDVRLGAVPMDKINIKQHEYPKLKVLSLEVLSDYRGVDRNKKYKTVPLVDNSFLFTFVKAVIENAPNLDTVEFKIDLDIQNRNTIQKCLTEFGILEKPKLLTSLTILCGFNKVDWQSLIIMGLKLKTFKITFGDLAVDSRMMKVFLESQANTLSSLELDLPVNLGHGVSTDFPILPQLKYLRIRDDYNVLKPETRLRFPSLSYQTQFPALKELNLLQAKGPQVDDLFAARLAPFDTVEKLILPTLWGRIEMVQVVRLFPNVKKLHLNEMRDAQYMEVIYDNLTGIEELRLANLAICADCIITGLDIFECKQIKETPSASFNYAVERLSHAKTLGCLEKYILNSDVILLKDLKVLKIHQDKDQQRRHVEIGEISAYVLKKMKNLKRLDFGVRKFLPFVGKALLDDLEKHGIQVTSQLPPHKRAVLGLLPRDDDDDDDEYNVPAGPLFSPSISSSDSDEDDMLALSSTSGSDSDGNELLDLD